MPPRSMMDPDFEINGFEYYDSDDEEYDKVYYKKHGLRNGVVCVGYNNIDTVYINSRAYDDDDDDYYY